MGHASYYRCLAEHCGHRYATEEKPPLCPKCGGKRKEKIPAVTTILGSVGWKTEGLKHWAHSLGEQGIDMRDSLDTEATVGSLAHLAISADVNGRAFDLDALHLEDTQKARVRKALSAWKEWKANTRVEFIASEKPLISAAFNFGGTLDGGVATANGKIAIIDFKTGKVYAEALLQVAAYSMLWTENNPDRPIEQFIILQLGKDTGAFHHHMIPAEDMAPAAEAFAHAMRLHLLRKPIEALL